MNGKRVILAIGFIGGANFTREALVLLGDRGATVAGLGEFYWTDESRHSQP